MNADCIFCKIVAGAVPCNKVYEDDQVLAFYDIAPKAKTHILIIPKKHISSVTETSDLDEQLLGHLFLVSKKIAEEKNVHGYKLLTNVNKAGGQMVFHIHIHLLAGGDMHLEEC